MTAALLMPTYRRSSNTCQIPHQRRHVLEARLDSLERLTLAMHARISELSLDMQTSFQQIAAEQLRNEQRLEAKLQAVKDEILSEISTKIEQSERRTLDAFEKLIEGVKASKE